MQLRAHFISICDISTAFFSYCICLYVANLHFLHFFLVYNDLFTYYLKFNHIPSHTLTGVFSSAYVNVYGCLLCFLILYCYFCFLSQENPLYFTESINLFDGGTRQIYGSNSTIGIFVAFPATGISGTSLFFDVVGFTYIPIHDNFIFRVHKNSHVLFDTCKQIFEKT